MIENSKILISLLNHKKVRISDSKSTLKLFHFLSEVHFIHYLVTLTLIIKFIVSPFSGIDKPPTTRKPGSRRESKKTWKIDHNHEKKAVGMKDEPMLKGDDIGDEQIDFQSATASSSFHRHLFMNFGITIMTVILADDLST